MDALDDDIQVAIRISLEEENQRRLLEQQRLAEQTGGAGQPGQGGQPMVIEQRPQPAEYSFFT